MPIDLIQPLIEAMRSSEAAPVATTPPEPSKTENGALAPGESRALAPGSDPVPDVPLPAPDQEYLHGQD